MIALDSNLKVITNQIDILALIIRSNKLNLTFHFKPRSLIFTVINSLSNSFKIFFCVTAQLAGVKICIENLVIIPYDF